LDTAKTDTTVFLELEQKSSPLSNKKTLRKEKRKAGRGEVGTPGLTTDT